MAQMEEGIKVEEGMRKKYLEKEKKYQRMKVEVNILKGKLEEKDKHLRFQDITNILDKIPSIQRSPSIKYGIYFHESVKGESSSQASAMIQVDIGGHPLIPLGPPPFFIFSFHNCSTTYYFWQFFGS